MCLPVKSVVTGLEAVRQFMKDTCWTDLEQLSPSGGAGVDGFIMSARWREFETDDDMGMWSPCRCSRRF